MQFAMEANTITDRVYHIICRQQSSLIRIVVSRDRYTPTEAAAMIDQFTKPLFQDKSTDTFTRHIALRKQAYASNSPVCILSASDLLMFIKVYVIGNLSPDSIVEGENEIVGLDGVEQSATLATAFAIDPLVCSTGVWSRVWV